MAKKKRSRPKKGESYRLFQKPKYKYIAEIVSFENPEFARSSAKLLKAEFDGAKSKSKKLRIAKATQYAANRAKATGYRKKLSVKERSEFKEINKIYDKAAQVMWNKYKKLK